MSEDNNFEKDEYIEGDLEKLLKRMNRENSSSDDQIMSNYQRLLSEMDSLAKGVFDESDSASYASLALITMAGLSSRVALSKSRARGLKRDIDFAKADAYFRFRSSGGDDGKKLTETALAQMVLVDPDVRRICVEYNEAEKEAEEYSNIYNMIKEAHITFRGLGKKG